MARRAFLWDKITINGVVHINDKPAYYEESELVFRVNVGQTSEARAAEIRSTFPEYAEWAEHQTQMAYASENEGRGQGWL